MKRTLLVVFIAFGFTLGAFGAALESFSPTGEARLAATVTSSNVAFPLTGTPTLARVTNLGGASVAILMGTSNAVTVTLATGLILTPGSTVVLTVGSNTYLAAIGTSATNLSVDMGN